jgi:hypothetical protein
MAYPSNIETLLDLYVALNSWATFLILPIDAAVTDIAVQSAAGLQATNGLVAIDGEVILYGSINTGGLNPVLQGCTRGFDGTSPSPHSVASRVELRYVAAHHNRLAASLVAMQLVFGVTPQDDSLNGVLFTDLADRLTRTLPEAIPMALNAVWQFTHNRRRIINVQCWEDVGAGHFQKFDPTTSDQELNTGGVAQVTLTLTGPKAGYVVIN